MPQFADVAEQQRARLNRTSAVVPSKHPDELTLRFKRFTNHGGTAYQRDQCAGFLLEEAKKLVRAGKADVVDPDTGAVVPIDLTEPMPTDGGARMAPAAWAELGRAWLTKRSAGEQT